jgi:uncharacterized membrane protein YqiK
MPSLFLILGIGIALILVLTVMVMLTWYKKVPQGKAIVRSGRGGIKVSFNGMVVIPVLHRMEWMDISIKKVEIGRTGKDGLICKDNMRADIKVVFFVRVNPVDKDVMNVAQTIGVDRASREDTLVQLFEAKFSEALKTVGKQFNFVELYDARERFRQEIINTIGRNLNGYILDDAAIDYLEQTPISFLAENNILDSEGIKKITDLTAKQAIEANKIRREKEKVITQQDVEAQEAILELNRQLAEKQEVQKREVASIKAREEAEIAKIQAEERKRSETARITSDEEIAIANENKDRQIIVAQKSKERVAKVETERVEKDRALEANERERVVSLAQIEKEKVLETEKKNIQEVIRERVMVERATVEEQERIKDTTAFAEAERQRKVAITGAEKEAQEATIRHVGNAEMEKQATAISAETKIIEADTELKAAERKAEAKKKMAEAQAAEEAALGIAESQVIEAKALARQKEGEAEAKVMEMKALARQKEGESEAKVMEAKAIAGAKNIEVEAIAREKAGLLDANVTEKQAMAEAKAKEALAEALKKQGFAEANVLEEKLMAEAKGISQKAASMKQLDGVGREHEEFKLRLEKEKTIELAHINIQEKIAAAQAMVIAEAVKAAKIDIVGGETMFFEKIIGSITRGKSIDAMVDNSEVLTGVKNALLAGDGKELAGKLRGIISDIGLKSDDIKNLTISALILKMLNESQDTSLKGMLSHFLNQAWKAGIAEKPASFLGL